MFQKPFIRKALSVILFLGLTSSVEGISEKKSENVTSEPNLITFSKIDKAWVYSKGENTVVAILDWLFDLSPEASKKYIHPTSLIPGQKIGFAKPWHGEWMAEIVHQIAPKAKIIPIRARPIPKKKSGDKDGRQDYEKYLIEGIRFAADHGAIAVTNSMGPVKHCQELLDAVEYAENKGTIFINVHPEYQVYTKQMLKECDPNECDRRIVHPGLVSVPRHRTRPQRNRDIYVWPYQIYPKFKDGWGYSNGPPIVAGVMALMKSVNPKLTPKQVRQIILETAYTKDGFKVLDAEAAVKSSFKKSDEIPAKQK